MTKKYQLGIIDPLSLISTIFLIISLITATAVVSNPKIKQDIRNWAKEISDSGGGGRQACTPGSQATCTTAANCPGYKICNSSGTGYGITCSDKPNDGCPGGGSSKPTPSPSPTPSPTPVPTATPVTIVTTKQDCEKQNGYWSDSLCILPYQTNAGYTWCPPKTGLGYDWYHFVPGNSCEIADRPPKDKKTCEDQDKCWPSWSEKCYDQNTQVTGV
ncbi:MAG: hypothetical protein Q8P91_01540, partial [bacterium]|nr:hypothetical protein [bacterium]